MTAGRPWVSIRAGNVYLTGSFTTSVDVRLYRTERPRRSRVRAQATVFLAKYRPSGALVWVQTGDCTVRRPKHVGYRSGRGRSCRHGLPGWPSLRRTRRFRRRTERSVLFRGPAPGICSWPSTIPAATSSGVKPTQAEPQQPYRLGSRWTPSDNAYVTGWLEDATTFSSNDGNDITVTGFSPAQTTGDFPGDGLSRQVRLHDGNVKWVNHVGGYRGIGSAVAVSPTGEVSIVGFVGNINFGSPGEAETIATSQPPGARPQSGGRRSHESL